MTSLSIILITYNNVHELPLCLAALSNAYKNITTEIIIADNASTDDALKKIKLTSNEKLIKNKYNFGFAKACNQAAKIAKGKYLLFLNPDTIVTQDTISEMLRIIKGKKDKGILGCKVLNRDKTIQPSCGNFPTIFNVFLDRIPLFNKTIRTQLIRNEAYYQHDHEPDWISGVCMLMAKKTFFSLNGFDEKYFLYVEDVDLCYRAKKAGYKIYYSPNATIYHKDMGKTKNRKPFKARQIRKGISIFFTKYKSRSYCFLWQTLLRCESILRPTMKIPNS
jgi:hypothetical protein